MKYIYCNTIIQIVNTKSSILRWQSFTDNKNLLDCLWISAVNVTTAAMLWLKKRVILNKSCSTAQPFIQQVVDTLTAAKSIKQRSSNTGDGLRVFEE